MVKKVYIYIYIFTRWLTVGMSVHYPIFHCVVFNITRVWEIRTWIYNNKHMISFLHKKHMNGQCDLWNNPYIYGYKSLNFHHLHYLATLQRHSRQHILEITVLHAGEKIKKKMLVFWPNWWLNRKKEDRPISEILMRFELFEDFIGIILNFVVYLFYLIRQLKRMSIYKKY